MLNELEEAMCRRLIRENVLIDTREREQPEHDDELNAFCRRVRVWAIGGNVYRWLHKTRGPRFLGLPAFFQKHNKRENPIRYCIMGIIQSFGVPVYARSLDSCACGCLLVPKRVVWWLQSFGKIWR